MYLRKEWQENHTSGALVDVDKSLRRGTTGGGGAMESGGVLSPCVAAGEATTVAVELEGND